MKNKSKIILTVIVIMLPAVLGMIIWGKLPSEIPTHFNFSGEPDGFSSKAFAVLGLPLIILALHIVCLMGIKADPKQNNISPKIKNLILWICPVISVLIMTVSFSYAMGAEVPAVKIVVSLIGLFFIFMGNYLPKCKPNYTVGIKLPWTLNDSENWNKTHRMSGILFVICGFAAIISSFLGKAGTGLFIISLIAVILAPIAYSYRLYKLK